LPIHPPFYISLAASKELFVIKLFKIKVWVENVHQLFGSFECFQNLRDS
jgi:hypothetical protein